MVKNKESTGYILTVAIVLCLVCATLVSIAAVSLKGIQDKNAAKEIMRNILVAADIEINGDVQTLFDENIESKIVDIKKGEIDNNIDAKTFNLKKAIKNPATRIDLTTEQDTAKIRAISSKAIVYFKKSDGKIILPINGYGLWGTMYGFLALNKDGKTIEGISFYDHKETPGLGGEITNPKWQALWHGKKGYDESNKPNIELVKGGVNQNPEIAKHQVDSLAGATLTSTGVENTINFWLGENGYKLFLSKQAN